jgi:hypothetical protein
MKHFNLTLFAQKKYEFSLAIHEPQVVWVSGLHLPSTHDINVFCGGAPKHPEDWDRSSLYFKLKEGELIIGDSGYEGEPDKIVVAKEEHQPCMKAFIARAKNRQETFHTRLKSFNILGCPSWSKH